MILQYLKDHYDDPSLSVDSLVNQFKISKTYLYQIFRNSFSSTPGDILEQIRMDHAQNLLLNTEMNIADIADTCGYNSSNTFLKRVFIKARKEKRREALSGKDLLDIMNSLPRLREEDQALMGLLLFTGMRRGEVLGLRWIILSSML